MPNTILEFPETDHSSFRVPATDTHGHSERLWFRAQPGHAQAISSIIQGKRFPYKTKGDLCRHALIRHLKYLQSLADLPIKSTLQQTDAIIELLQDEEKTMEFMGIFDKLGERIASHLGNGGEGEARRLISKVQQLIDDMPDGYWRDKYEHEIAMRYGHIMKAAPRAKLGLLKD